MWKLSYEDYIGDLFSMSFNGTDLSPYLYVIDVTGRSISPNEISYVQAANGVRNHIRRKRKSSVPIQVKVLIRKKNGVELRKALDELNYLLDSEDFAPILFSDEPDKMYYGILSDVSEGLEVNGNHIVTLTFIRDGQQKYGQEKKIKELTVYNEGTVEATPFIEVEFTAGAQDFTITHSNGKYVKAKYDFPNRGQACVRCHKTKSINKWSSPNVSICSEECLV